jgi:hypothetical protein
VSCEPTPIRLEPERNHCKLCGKNLIVQKTKTRTAVTLSGQTSLVLVTRSCPDHPNEVYPPVNTITPYKSKYGYDVIAETGRLRFLENRQVSEIRSNFLHRGITIPERTVHWLCDRFLQYLIAVHWDSIPAIANLVKEGGGYVLHVDSSGSRGPMVLLLKDGWSGIRLLTARIQSEGADYVKPHLENLKDHLDDPVVVVRDMSEGLKKAVNEVFPEVYVIICHYHFLRNVAMKLFDPLYPRFRNRMNRIGVMKRLRKLRCFLAKKEIRNEDEIQSLEIIEYILSYKKDGEGLAYPFSLPAVNFYRRCLKAAKTTRKAILERASMFIYSPFLSALQKILQRIQPPPPVLGRLRVDFDDLGLRWNWFQKIRRVLRYRNGPIPLSTHVRLSDKDLEKGRVKLDRVIDKIRLFDEEGGTDPHSIELKKSLRKVSAMLDEHRNALFAPNVSVEVQGKTIVRKLPRTNAPDETDFRMARRHARRIRGNSDIEPQFQRDGPGLLIAHNLKNRDYVRSVYGSLSNMANRFSSVSSENLKGAMPYLTGQERISGGDNP